MAHSLRSTRSSLTISPSSLSNGAPLGRSTSSENVSSSRFCFACRSLDDDHPNEQFVTFVHRPESGTPLKNGVDGERAVDLSEVIVALVSCARVTRPQDSETFRYANGHQTNAWYSVTGVRF
jgi:hypothetical protein